MTIIQSLENLNFFGGDISCEANDFEQMKITEQGIKRRFQHIWAAYEAWADLKWSGIIIIMGSRVSTTLIISDQKP